MLAARPRRVLRCPPMATKKSKQTPKKPLFTRKKKAAKKPAQRAVKKAAKKSAAGSAAAAPAGKKRQTKTAFVLSFPADTPAKEVVAKGAEAGIQLSEKGVYKTRYLARSKGAKAAKKPAKVAKNTPAKAAPKKAVKAPKKGKRGPGDGRGSAFIRSMPLDMKASAVVAAAAKEGISITAGLVYSVRKAGKKGGAKVGQATGKRRGRPAKAAKPPVKLGTGGSDRERQLLALALDLGLGRSVELIEDLKAKIGSLI